MDIHKPHAAKSWREFFIEIGTIVVGILIALGLEQVIETIHWRHEAEEAEASIDAEIESNAASAYVRLAAFDCAEGQLDKIDAALVASRDHGQPVPLMAPYQRAPNAFSDDAWRAALSSGVANHIPRDMLLNYSKVYVFVLDQRDNMVPHDLEAMDRLNTLTVNAGRLQPAERDRLFQALVFARRNVFQGAFSAYNLLQNAETVGITISPKDRAESLAVARRNYGACAHEPVPISDMYRLYYANFGNGGPLVQPK